MFNESFPQPVELLLEYQEAVRNIETLTIHPQDPKSPAHYAWGRVQEVWGQYKANFDAGRDVRWEVTIIRSNIRLMLEKACVTL